MCSCALILLLLLKILVLISIPAGASNYMYQSQEKWEEEWGKGLWDYMDVQTTERSKNAVIGSVFTQEVIGKNGTLLDVGCGEGAISDHLLPTQIYVGMDISKEAIRRAKEKRGANQGSTENNVISANIMSHQRKFVHMNAYDFVPSHKFDVIVFSDMLYYLDHENLLKQYARYLNPGGHVIIAIFAKSTDKLMYENIFSTARALFNKVDEIDVGGWTMKRQNGKREKTAFHLEMYKAIT